MKAKLHKMESGYILSLNGDIDDPYGIVNKELAEDYEWCRLSPKNCQAIELGYDLDKLVLEFIGEDDGHPSTADHSYCFKKGFQKALEILGDKKFSEQDVRDAYFNGEKDSYTKGGQTKEMENEYIQSLQQTEWDVEVEMECVMGCRNLMLNGENSVCCGDKKPKLDEDNCLILKKL